MPNITEKESFIERLTEIINANITNEKFRVNDLARDMRMSRSNLHRKVISLTGKSISKFICVIRLEKAQELLIATPSSISEIAFECGFHSVTYFTKCYKDHFGHPPSDVRKHMFDIAISEDRLLWRVKKGIKGTRVRNLYVISVILILMLVIVILMIIKPMNSRTETRGKSIAVLPFVNDSPEESDMYFIDGTMEAILDNLGKIGSIRVVSRTSVEQYRNHPKPIKYIGREMNVSYVVEGSGLKDGEKIKLTVKLIDAENDKRLWSNNYNADIKDIFALLSEIAQQVAQEIRAIITPEEKALIEKIPTTSQTAWDLYLQASSIARYSADDETLEKALIYLHLSLAYDSCFVNPYGEIAAIYQTLYERNPSEKTNLIDSIQYYADKVISLDWKNRTK